MSIYEHICIESSCNGDSSFTVDCKCSFDALSLHQYWSQKNHIPLHLVSGENDACKVSSYCYWKRKLAGQGSKIINATYRFSYIFCHHCQITQGMTDLLTAKKFWCRSWYFKTWVQYKVCSCTLSKVDDW
mgnify:CR=1 FL=1